MLRRRPSALILSSLAIVAAVAAAIVIAAVSGVVTYRLFNLILVSVPSLLANRLLHPSLTR